jgi:hypothetical protein
MREKGSPAVDGCSKVACQKSGKCLFWTNCGPTGFVVAERVEKVKTSHETVLDMLLGFHKVCHFTSIEGKTRIMKEGERELQTMEASPSEIRRWLENHAVEINGTTAWKHDDEWPEIKSLVLFPKSAKRRCTLL